MMENLALGLRFLPEAALLTETVKATGLERVIFANPACERLTGYSAKDLMEHGLAVLQGPETDAKALQRLLHPLATEEVTSFDLLLYTKSGTPFWDRVKINHVETADSLLRVQVHSDITQNKEVQKWLILAQKRSATSHLVSSLVHDFNNLLTAILVYSGLISAQGKNDAQLQRYVSEVENSAERGRQLANQLLDLGREETDKPDMVDLCQLVEENIDLLTHVLGKDINLIVQASPNLKKVRVHPGRIQQVLLNLVINARDAMPDGGQLEVQIANEEPVNFDKSSSPAQSYTLLLVRDTGIGMDSGTLANIFTPYFSTKSKGKGAGLGLFAVRTIVDQYGGMIDVESELGKGATFKILLPSES